jgi:hypothetical protein
LPCSILYGMKTLVIIALIALTFTDMAFMLIERSSDGGVEINDVQVVSVSIKAATFVS